MDDSGERAVKYSNPWASVFHCKESLHFQTDRCNLQMHSSISTPDMVLEIHFLPLDLLLEVLHLALDQSLEMSFLSLDLFLNGLSDVISDLLCGIDGKAAASGLKVAAIWSTALVLYACFLFAEEQHESNRH